MREKRAQVTIFVIVAVVIVAAVVLFLVLRDGSKNQSELPSDFEAPYLEFVSCLEDELSISVDLLESQGGYIYPIEFEAGSTYAPLSNQLNFVGTNIPYWYYISANGFGVEQVPTKESMESEIERFVSERIGGCDLGDYSLEGFSLELGEPVVSATINTESVEAKIDMNFFVSKGIESARIGNHDIVIGSYLGRLYESALKVYEKEQSELFLESYGVDTLRLSAPVDGVEITCSPLVWNAQQVREDLFSNLEANVYSLSNYKEEGDYFFVDLGVSERVNFITSSEWPNNFEVLPGEDVVLISEPVGNQGGLGILGFCYVPYHYVYNVDYGVLAQVSWEDETFQFPMAVVIKGNKEREAVPSVGNVEEVSDFCKYKNVDAQITTNDFNFNRVDSTIYYECASSRCLIGETENGILNAEFPQCANGIITAKAQGYEDSTIAYSSLNPGSVELVLKELHPLEINLFVDGSYYDGEAIIYFLGNDSSKTVVYPSTKAVELIEGGYEIQVYIYENSSLVLGESVQEQCVEVPRGGIGGVIGLTKEECYEVVIPEQVITNALSGGGTQEYYFLDNRLSSSSTINIKVGSLIEPKTLEELQFNYIAFDDKGVEVDFS